MSRLKWVWAVELCVSGSPVTIEMVEIFGTRKRESDSTSAVATKTAAPRVNGICALRLESQPARKGPAMVAELQARLYQPRFLARASPCKFPLVQLMRTGH